MASRVLFIYVSPLWRQLQAIRLLTREQKTWKLCERSNIVAVSIAEPLPLAIFVSSDNLMFSFFVFPQI